MRSKLYSSGNKYANIIEKANEIIRHIRTSHITLKEIPMCARLQHKSFLDMLRRNASDCIGFVDWTLSPC